MIFLALNRENLAGCFKHGKMWIPIFWDFMMYFWPKGSRHFEDESYLHRQGTKGSRTTLPFKDKGTAFLRNVGNTQPRVVTSQKKDSSNTRL